MSQPLININLTPFEELENKSWFVVDLAIALVIAVLVYMFGKSQIASMESKIARFDEEIAEFESNIKNVEEGLKEIDDLQSEVDELKGKIASVSAMTDSDVARYESVMLVEFMQVLKPVGMWYQSLNMDSNSKKINITGYVHDPAMVADFMRSLQSTKNNQAGEGDLRSKIYFDSVAIKKFQGDNFSLQGDFPPLKRVHSFELEFSYKTR